MRTKVTPEEILLEVEDNGCGIEAELIPELFDKYFRINSTIEGSGLGLFIVKRMVENRGRRIEVVSKVGCSIKEKIWDHEFIFYPLRIMDLFQFFRT